MAGEFDDLIPNGGATAGGGTFDDLVPPSVDQQRRDRLRKMASTSMRQMDGAPGAGDLFSHNVTLGLQKPVGGLASAIGGEVRELFGGEPATFGERYRAQTGAYDERLAEAEKNAGWGGTAAGLAGGLLAGGPARSAVSTGLLPMVRDAALLGGVEGAANNAESFADAAKGALGGAATAGTTTGALALAGKGINRMRPSWRERRAAVREANRGPSPEDLRNQARPIYRQLDENGIAYSNAQATQFADAVEADLLDAGYDRSLHSGLNDVVRDLAALRGQPVSLETLQNLRRRIGSAAGGPDPDMRRVSGRLLGVMEDFVSNQDPALVTGNLPPDQVAPLWREARRLWRTAGMADDIGWRLDNADLRAASTNSGQNTDNAIRQNIRDVVKKSTKPRSRNPYSPEEIAQMRRVVEGTTGQNLLRSGGNYLAGMPAQALTGLVGTGGAAAGLGGNMFDPTTLGLASAAGLGLGYGVQRLGHGMKDMAARMSEENADDLMRLISTGSMAGGRQVMQPTREELAAAMLARSLGRYTGMEATR